MEGNGRAGPSLGGRVGQGGRGEYLVDLVLQAHIDIDMGGNRVGRLHLQLLGMGLQVVRLEGHVLSLRLRLSLQQDHTRQAPAGSPRDKHTNSSSSEETCDEVCKLLC